uniref:Reverse transcriptase domain-containing protein n=1 Tax=Angiostrongylus cantonensis TaxID=6313 RepID=A0A0K0DDN5_ANGCA
MMENPPPMAEQFLIDLRRVIEIARERIRMRRFVPMLITIPEDLEEDNAEKAVSDMYHESPKSDKSVDSGRESRSDSDDSSRDEEEEEKTRNWPDVHSQPDRIHKVRSIVNGSG